VLEDDVANGTVSPRLATAEELSRLDAHGNDGTAVALSRIIHEVDK